MVQYFLPHSIVKVEVVNELDRIVMFTKKTTLTSTYPLRSSGDGRQDWSSGTSSVCSISTTSSKLSFVQTTIMI